NPDFEESYLGTFGDSNSLILNGAENKTFKCGSDNILNGWLNYRIYPISETAPPFASNEIPYTTNEGGAGSGCQNQLWQSSGANINILNGLLSGDYYLEVYTHADVDTNNDNIFDFSIYANAGGTNYRATFRVDTPPVAECQPIMVFLDAAGTATITPAQINNNSSDDFAIVFMT